MEKISFKQRIITEASACSITYKANFLNYDYLICSAAFKEKDYYVIRAHKDNFQHLIGVNALIPPSDFFDKCYNGTLLEADFNFVKKGQTEKDVKGAVRRKLSVLPMALDIFNKQNVYVEENFQKNRVFCSFATADTDCTFGFINAKYSVPKTLLKSNELNSANACKVDLILRKKKWDKQFGEILFSDNTTIENYIDKIADIVTSDLVKKFSPDDKE